ncbi:MAG: hypothetical protein WBD47_12250, partial [Phormidesmis sp.]
KYGRTTEFVASLIMVLSFSFLLAGNLVAGGYLFQTFLGLSYFGGVTLIATLVLVYTVSGGLFAVAYTDAVQVAIAFFGALVLLGFIGFNFGLEIPAGMGPFDFEQLTVPASGSVINWATILALGLGDIVAIDFMARIFAADSPETAQRACFIGCAGTLIIGIPFSMIALSANRILEGAGVVPDGPVLFALLGSVIPPAISLLVIMAIMSASLSTADGAILGTSSVIAHNVMGIRHGHDAPNNSHNGHVAQAGGDQLLKITRLMAVVITVIGVFFALRIPQTGVLLLLAFDLGFAGLVIPLTGGLFWPKATWQGALSCIIVGSLTRLIFFVLTPMMFGVENTLLYIPNGLFADTFDGFPTLISPIVGLIVFVVVSKMTYVPVSAQVTERQKVLTRL